MQLGKTMRGVTTYFKTMFSFRFKSTYFAVACLAIFLLLICITISDLIYNDKSVEPSPKSVESADKYLNLLPQVVKANFAILSNVTKIKNTAKVLKDKIIYTLNDLNRLISSLVGENKVYGNIFSGENVAQLESYLIEIKSFQATHPINQICEIGFAGGHSATLFLEATAESNASYVGFDNWNRPVYEDGALQWVKNRFPTRDIKLIKGDSTKTVLQNAQELSGKCDLIHVDGAHHADYPKTDLINMAKLAAKHNLLLIDDCTESWPAVLLGVDYITDHNMVVSRPKEYQTEGWTYRGAVKGWCVGEYNTGTHQTSETEKQQMMMQSADVRNQLASFDALKRIIRPYTIVVSEKLKHLYDSTLRVLKNNIPGAMVECGVFKGGAQMMVAYLLQERNISRQLWLYDTFEGLPAPVKGVDDERSVDMWQNMAVDNNVKAGQTSKSYIDFNGTKRWNYETLSHVQNRFKEFNRVNTTFVKGKVEDTLKYHVPDGEIAILRLDTDWYTSTKFELMVLAQKLSYGGVLIIDDYCTWGGARRATDEFMTLHGDCFENVVSIGKTCYHATRTRKPCSFGKKLTFVDREFCLPPWSDPICSTFNNYTCSTYDDRCFYEPEYGVASISCDRWYIAQKTEKVKWDNGDTSTDRNMAHAQSFNDYKSLPEHLGHVVEIGAGPYTQSQTILNHSKKKMKSITLIEPMAFQYINKVKNYFYGNGAFANISSTILGIPAEDLSLDIQFDTLVMVNVIENVYDAFSILDKAIRMIKPGGFFVWHECIWNNYQGFARSKYDLEFKLHPIRLKSVVADVIMQQFDRLYYANDTQEMRRLRNEGVYFIGRKKENPVHISNLPYHPPCVNNKNEGSITVIFAILTAYLQDINNNIKIASKHSDVEKIILVATEDLEINIVQEFVHWDKVKVFISNNSDWKTQVSKYVSDGNACQFSTRSISQSYLDSTDLRTVCVIP